MYLLIFASNAASSPASLGRNNIFTGLYTTTHIHNSQERPTDRTNPSSDSKDSNASDAKKSALSDVAERLGREAFPAPKPIPDDGPIEVVEQHAEDDSKLDGAEAEATVRARKGSAFWPAQAAPSQTQSSQSPKDAKAK